MTYLKAVMAAGLGCAASLLFAGEAAAQSSTSAYTPLQGRACRSRPLNPDDPVDGGGRTCPGVAGYRLRIETGDEREFVTVIDPRGSAHDLRLTEVVTSAFSSVGERAEWRTRGRRSGPHAVIFRLNHQRNEPGGTGEARPLVVARLDRPCVIAVVPAGRLQNERARAAADRGGSCLGSRG